MYLFIYSELYSCIHPSDIHVFYLHMYLFISNHPMEFVEKCPAIFFSLLPHSLLSSNNKRYVGGCGGRILLRDCLFVPEKSLRRQMTVFRALLVHIVGWREFSRLQNRRLVTSNEMDAGQHLSGGWMSCKGYCQRCCWLKNYLFYVWIKIPLFIRLAFEIKAHVAFKILIFILLMFILFHFNDFLFDE